MNTLFKKQSDKVYGRFNASASQILTDIRNAFSGASPNTVCVFIYTGHGYTSYGDYSGAFACSDGTCVTVSTLKSTMDSLNVNNIVILLGSCGSGGLIDPNGEEKKDADFDPVRFNNAFINAFKTPASNAGEFATKGYTVIAAAAAHRTGMCYWWNDSYGTTRNGYTELMHALGKAGGYDWCNNSGNYVGWISKKGDSSGDNKVSVKEAYQYARKQVKDSTVQFWSSRSGLILFQ